MSNEKLFDERIPITQAFLGCVAKALSELPTVARQNMIKRIDRAVNELPNLKIPIMERLDPDQQKSLERFQSQYVDLIDMLATRLPERGAPPLDPE